MREEDFNSHQLVLVTQLNTDGEADTTQDKMVSVFRLQQLDLVNDAHVFKGQCALTCISLEQFSSSLWT